VRWLRILWVGVVVGVVFVILDVVLNANPLGAQALEFYAPIARDEVLMPVGIVSDLVSGFLIVLFFTLFYSSLPSSSGIVKGIIFGLIVSFLRVVMNVAASITMFQVPMISALYALGAGILEMTILGFLAGLLYRPRQAQSGADLSR
jgi:hypothetical protein